MERPSAFRKALRIVAQTLIVLGITELTMDVAFFVRRVVLDRATQEQAKKDIVWHRDDYLRGRIVPRQRNVRVGPAQANINSLGFRGAEPRGAPYRVVCLGDSVTFGWGVSREDATYPAALEKTLAPQGVEVLNAGMPRWNSCDLLDLYVTRIATLRPQALVILAGWNDIGYELLRSADGDDLEASSGLLWQAAREVSSLAHVTDGALRRIGDFERTRRALHGQGSGRDAVQWERLDEFGRILTAIVQLARRDGSQPVLVTLPHFLGPSLPEAQKQKMLPHLLAWPDVSSKGWWRGVTRTNEEIRGVSRSLAVPLADCEHSVAPGHFTDLAHLDEEGNRQLAACVVRTLGPLVTMP